MSKIKQVVEEAYYNVVNDPSSEPLGVSIADLQIEIACAMANGDNALAERGRKTLAHTQSAIALEAGEKRLEILQTTAKRLEQVLVAILLKI